MSCCAGPSTAVFTPILPTELWLRIFRLATDETLDVFETGYSPFRDIRPVSAANLGVKRAIFLVCKRWGALGERLLYEDIRIVGHGTRGLLDALERTEESGEEYGHHVRRITLSTGNVDIDAAVLKHCPNVEVLIKPQNNGIESPIMTFPFPDHTFKSLESVKRIDWSLGTRSGWDFPSDASLSFLWYILQLTPNLHYLSLSGDTPWGLVSHTKLLHDLHLEQLQVLRIKELALPIIHGTLEWQVPHLTHLIVDTLDTVLITHPLQLRVVELLPQPKFTPQPLILDLLILCPQLRDLSYYVDSALPPAFDEGFVSHTSLQCVRLHSWLNGQVRPVSSRQHIDSHLAAICGRMSVALERVVLYGDWSEFFGNDESLTWLPLFKARNCTLEFHD